MLFHFPSRRAAVVLALVVLTTGIAGCDKAKSALLDQVRDQDALAQQRAASALGSEIDKALDKGAQAPQPAPVAAAAPHTESAAAAAAAVPDAPPLGRKRFAIEPGPTQLIEFTTDAPVETIRGQSNGATGFIDVDLDHPGQGTLAEIHLPVAEMRTGIPLRDEHMRSDKWLDAKKFPEIKLIVKAVPPQAPAIRVGHPAKLAVTAALTIHGVTHDIEIPDVTATFLPFDASLEKVYILGDVLRVKGSWQIKLSDYGVTVPDQLIGKKVSNEVELRVAITAIAPRAKP